MKTLIITISISLTAYFLLTRERCIPFENWGAAVMRSEEDFEACIQPNIDCENAQKKNPGLKCIWNDCPLIDNGKVSLQELAGYPGRRLVCENDCGLSIFNYCIYSGRQNSEAARRALTGASEALKEFE